MPDLSYTPDPAAVVSAADVLRIYLQREAPETVALMFNADFEGMAMALAAEGRLLPPDVYVDEEYQYGTEKRTVWVGPWQPASGTEMRETP